MDVTFFCVIYTFLFGYNIEKWQCIVILDYIMYTFLFGYITVVWLTLFWFWSKQQSSKEVVISELVTSNLTSWHDRLFTREMTELYLLIDGLTVSLYCHICHSKPLKRKLWKHVYWNKKDATAILWKYDMALWSFCGANLFTRKESY